MVSERGRRPVIRVEITPASVIVVVVAIVASGLTAEVLVSARRILSWVVACAVVAALIGLVVQWLDRWLQRVVALILVLLSIGVIVSGLVFGLLNDLDHEVRAIQTDAPAAARSIERSNRFGTVAKEIDLADRVTAAVNRLSQPSSGLAGEAVSSVGTYLVCIILTILFLSWGPRLYEAGLSQLDDERAARVRAITLQAFRRSRSYVTYAIIQAVCVGLIAWGVCRYADLPAPIPLALAMAAMSLVPNLGILLGGLPMLLLTFSLDSYSWPIGVGIFILALQTFSSLIAQPLIVKHSGLYVGPAIVSIAGLIGFELYGIGGALYAAALVVMGVAVLDSAAESNGDREDVPEPLSDDQDDDPLSITRSPGTEPT